MTLLTCQILNHLLYKLARDLVSFGPEEGLYPLFDVTVNHCHGRFQVYICQTRWAFHVVVVVVDVVVVVVVIVVHKLYYRFYGLLHFFQKVEYVNMFF